MTPPQPPVLLFDVMSTLVYDPFYREVPGFFGMTLDELLAQKHPTAWRDFERNEMDETTLYRRFFDDGRPFDGPGMKSLMRDTYRWLDGVEPLLAELSKQGYEMHALSNYPMWYRVIEAKLGVSRYVRWTFVSCKTRVRKPEPEAYLGAARVLRRAPDACVFIDDKERNCAGAREVGMPAIRFEDAAKLREALQGLGVALG